MSVDFGTDIDCTTSIGSRFKLVSGFRNLANAMYRRLTTPRGNLDYAPDYGIDVRDFLNHDIKPSSKFSMKSAIEGELAKDERVQDVTATLDFNRQQQILTITVAADTAAGPFKFVVTVDKLNALLTSVSS